MTIAMSQGCWVAGGASPAFDAAGLAQVIHSFREPAHLIQHESNGAIRAVLGGKIAAKGAADEGFPWLATLPPLYPEWLGDRTFQEVHGTRFPYVVGEMAGGISGPELIIAAARCGTLGFLGTGGLPLNLVEQALETVRHALAQGLPWGANLIHTPTDPAWEEGAVELFLRHGVRRVCASAYVMPTPSVVRYACTGLKQDAQGRIRRTHRLFAKVSRLEVAQHFLSPAPAPILNELVAKGHLTEQEACLAREVPLVEDITAEADSGGHTDSRPLTVLIPAIKALAEELRERYHYVRPIRVGAAGGIGTPAAAAAAFAMGAAYIVTGSINQAAVEAATSIEAKHMLAGASLADVALAPSADMFELGAKVQVLRKGTMFAPRATKLYELYATYGSLEALPQSDVERLARELFRMDLDAVWKEVETFFAQRDPGQLERARVDARHRMALVFRYYLGNSSRWAIAGEPSRQLDYQIWCGPAMGAFNEWVAGSFLADPGNRTVSQMALNLLEGAAVLTRAHQLRSHGVAVPASAYAFTPRPLNL